MTFRSVIGRSILSHTYSKSPVIFLKNAATYSKYLQSFTLWIWQSFQNILHLLIFFPIISLICFDQSHEWQIAFVLRFVSQCYSYTCICNTYSPSEPSIWDPDFMMINGPPLPCPQSTCILCCCSLLLYSIFFPSSWQRVLFLFQPSPITELVICSI